MTSDNTAPEGTGVTAIAVAFDGTIYAGVEETAGTPLNGYDLFRPTYDGYWSYSVTIAIYAMLPSFIVNKTGCNATFHLIPIRLHPYHQQIPFATYPVGGDLPP